MNREPEREPEPYESILKRKAAVSNMTMKAGTFALVAILAPVLLSIAWLFGVITTVQWLGLSLCWSPAALLIGFAYAAMANEMKVRPD